MFCCTTRPWLLNLCCFVFKGVLSKGRADDLRRLPIQKCDILLHEAGAPPIHTPLAELEKLPSNVRDRLYVVHTAAIPPDCDLKVAPTGTAGTIRLDSMHTPSHAMLSTLVKQSGPANITAENLQDGKSQNITMVGKHNAASTTRLIKQFNGRNGKAKVAPLVFLRPTDVSDAWFILNLLSAVPFLSRLAIFANAVHCMRIVPHTSISAAFRMVTQWNF